MISSAKRQNEYLGYRNGTPERTVYISSIPVLIGAAMIAVAILLSTLVNALGTRYIGIEGPTDESAWLIDRLTGSVYRCQASVRGKAAALVDTLVGAGANTIGGISFMVSQPSKLLDEAREQAVADARRKAEIYAKAAGVTPALCLNHGATISFYFADPDGHKNELLIDTMPMEMAEELIHTPEFAANTIGTPFDPDELLAHYEAGAPLAELMKIGLEHAPAN